MSANKWILILVGDGEIEGHRDWQLIVTHSGKRGLGDD